MQARKPYDWRVFRVLAGLIVPASFTLLPFALHMQSAYQGAGTDTVPGWAPLLFDTILKIMLVALLGGWGLALARRTGLGLPLIESWVHHEPAPGRFRSLVARGWLVGIGCGLLILFLDFQVFRQPMLSMFRELGIETPKKVIIPPFYGFLAAISAGINEEIVFRLFGLSLLVWLLGHLIPADAGRPGPAVFWIANIIFAILFGAAHLIPANAIGWPMNTLVLTRTFVLNGAAGIAFGWLFWAYGLESAMLGHFFTDIVLYTLLPIILLQAEGVPRALAVAGASAVILSGVIMAVWAIANQRQNARDNTILKPP